MNVIIPLIAVGGAAALALIPTDASASSPLSSSTTDTPSIYLTDDGDPVISYPSNVDPSKQVQAFLAVLRSGESSGRYNVLVGGSTFSDYSHHPAFADATMTKQSAWGAAPGYLNSHAAGAYQFQPGTFRDASNAVGLAGDFHPASQDAAAVWDLKRKGAYDAIVNGDLATAFNMLTSEWTSLVSMGQAWVYAQFQSNGGVITA